MLLEIARYEPCYDFQDMGASFCKNTSTETDTLTEVSTSGVGNSKTS